MFAKLLAGATCASLALAQEEATLQQVIVLSNSGQQYPSTFINKSNVDEKALAGLEDQVSPLGQRQQFLIGSELRSRYVDEAKLLRADYLIGQVYLQTPQIASNIQSLQAQMMGLFPSTEQNDLNEWQQGNAVPPIEGADFSKWQEELGAHALPFGLNTFPINQYGRASDYMLAASHFNCPKFDELWSAQDAANEDQWAAVIERRGPISLTFLLQDGYSVQELCDYTYWAYTGYVDLENPDDWEYMRTNVCPRFLKDQNEAQATIDMENNYLASSGFMQFVNDAITNYDGPSADSLVYNSMQVMDSYHLYTLAAATANSTHGLLPGAIDSKQVLPGTALVFEVYSDQTVKAFFRDQEFTPAGCQWKEACSTSDFMAALQAKITVDQSEACK